MNRAKRRRQEKLEGHARKTDSDSRIRALLSQGMIHHKSQDYPQAEILYRQALEIVPRHPEALHLLGLVAYHRGQAEQAIDLLTQATQSDKRNAGYFYNLGTVYQKTGKSVEAQMAFQQAITLNPKYADAQYSLGNVLAECQEFEEAIHAYQRALSLNPSLGNAYNNMGVAYKEQGQWDEALTSYSRALALNPDHAEANYNRGIVLQKMGRLEEGEHAFIKAIAVRPTYAKAYHSLGLNYLWLEQLGQAHQAFHTSAELHQNQSGLKKSRSLSSARLIHDLEQLGYLIDRGRITKDHEAYVEASKVLDVLGCRNHEKAVVDSLQPQEVIALSEGLRKVSYRSECAALPSGSALNPDLAVDDIEARYCSQVPEVLCLDSLLSEEALQRLRAFCLESTIWTHEYENGYLGSFLGQGFSSPLLLQISEELRLTFPRIFKQHRLKQAWAFKCDNTLQALNIHADAAAVNVNFWITEDSANLDSNTGGLVLWNKEAPASWNFQEYNSQQNKPKILEFLQNVGAEKIVVSYRENRAVIFNSDLFHESDQFHFKDQYDCRRINVTLLYGNRGESV